VNPGVARLAIVVALVVGGVAVLANGFSEPATGALPGDSQTPTPTGSPSQPAQSPQRSVVPKQRGVLVQVFNGTFAAGFAGDFQELLEDQGGYLPAGSPEDAQDKPVVDSIVYFRRDANATQTAQNRADAQLLSETYLGSVRVEALPAELDDVADPAADVIVVLGEDQAGVT
jgi:hypothetical protein